MGLTGTHVFLLFFLLCFLKTNTEHATRDSDPGSLLRDADALHVHMNQIAGMRRQLLINLIIHQLCYKHFLHTANLQQMTSSKISLLNIKGTLYKTRLTKYGLLIMSNFSFCHSKCFQNSSTGFVKNASARGKGIHTQRMVFLESRSFLNSLCQNIHCVGIPSLHII